MLRIVAVVLALAVYQASAGAVEVLPAAPVAPVATAVVTARSSQYFAQNHNTLSAPLVAPVAAVQPVAPVVAPAARLEAVAPAVAPAARLEAVAPAVAPVYQYVAPSSASVSQVTRYAQYIAPAVAQYIAAPYVASAPFVASAPLLASPVVAPLIARAPAAVASTPVQAVAPQQPAGAVNPAFQTPNPDSESVDIESARLRAVPQARNQPQQNFAGYQEQLVAQNQRSGARAVPQNQQAQPVAKNQVRSAPGQFSLQQFIQGPYVG